jgi:threonine synthase
VGLEVGKVIGTLVYGPIVFAVDGTYDDVNRLCSELADRHPWAFVNVNLRPYYAEGSKTVGYEIAEQLGWRTPAHVVVPCAGGALLTKIRRARSPSSRTSGSWPGGRRGCTRRRPRAAGPS